MLSKDFTTVQDFRKIACFGVAGNFTGHLEQAGEAKDFEKIHNADKNEPKALFPTYLPYSKKQDDDNTVPNYLTGFPFDGSKILSKGKELLMRGINITEGYIRHSDDIDRYFDEDASSKYMAVLAADILSQYAYLQYFANMTRSLKCKLIRGTGNEVDQLVAKIVMKYGEKVLLKTTKTNFNDSKKVQAILSK